MAKICSTEANKANAKKTRLQAFSCFAKKTQQNPFSVSGQVNGRRPTHLGKLHPEHFGPETFFCQFDIGSAQFCRYNISDPVDLIFCYGCHINKLKQTKNRLKLQTNFSHTISGLYR